MAVLTEQTKEESLMMLWLKDQRQRVMYRLEAGKERNGSRKTQTLMTVTETKQWMWEWGRGDGCWAYHTFP